MASGQTFRRTRRSLDILTEAKKLLKKQEYSDALVLLQRVEENELEAMFLLGVVYFDGLGVEIDVVRACEYMEKIVAVTDLVPDELLWKSLALENLATLYYRGIAVPKDDELAEKYWLEAATMSIHPKTKLPHRGSVRAQNALGMFYSHPDHHQIDKAYFWHSKAYNNGHIYSEGALGVMYLYGFGVDEDPILAYGHLLHASSNGDVYAQGYLTAFYFMRKMFHRTVEMGKMLCEYEDLDEIAQQCGTDIETVRKGVALGHYYLALCYGNGYVVTKDIPLAKQLVNKAMELCPTIVVDLHEKAILGII